MAGQGTATLDFGTFPGKSDATVAVTGQTGILSNSLAEAWVYPVATGDHSADEHIAETIQVAARDIVAGVGFTIQGWNTSQLNEPVVPGSGGRLGGGQGTRIYGQWTVAWAWN